MSTTSDADWEMARAIIPRHRGLCDFDWHTGPNGPGCTCGADRERFQIATALADERRRATEPTR